MLADLTRLQRQLQRASDLAPTIRGAGSSGFPALNVGGTPEAIEIHAFAPGVDPESLEVHLERGLMTIAGKRQSAVAPAGDDADPKRVVHINERFDGTFRRAVALADDADPDGVTAALRDGILHITVPRRAAAQPRRIEIQ